MRALVSTLLASVCVLGVAVGARGSESGSQCPMLLKRVSLTGSIKTLACYRMRTDGYAKFTRDHRWLIYQPRGFEYRTSVVRIARTDGSADREVMRFTDGQITAFSVSPDDRTLAFTSTPFPDRSGIYGTWIVDLDGTKLRKISSETVVSAYGDSLGWSPDSKRIVFTRASSEP